MENEEKVNASLLKATRVRTGPPHPGAGWGGDGVPTGTPPEMLRINPARLGAAAYSLEQGSVAFIRFLMGL